MTPVGQSSVKSPEAFLSLFTFTTPAAALPPAVVGVGSVGFRHLVQLVLLLDDVALLDRGRQQFLGKFFIHVHAPVFVVPALCDHPLHSEEATSVVRKRNGHLVELSAFLYAGQSDDRLTVLQSLVEDGEGVTLDLLFLPLWSFVVFLHLFPLYVLQRLYHDLSGQNLVSMFHHHVDEFTEDWIAEHRAGDAASCCLDGSERFELPLLLLLSAELRLWFAVGLLADLWLQIVRVVSAPSHQEHPRCPRF